ncbi:MAG: response regulator [Planctomycetes bacterium]|nr:response regulator [Planctomycetota bacterium]
MADEDRGYRILVVEDNETNRLVAADMLEALGFSSEVVKNGRLAVDRVRRGGIDLVLMDFRMPELDGFEATREIRELEEREGMVPIPIVALTASAMPGDHQRCVDVGMNGLLRKPFCLSELEQTILAFLPGDPIT